MSWRATPSTRRQQFWGGREWVGVGWWGVHAAAGPARHAARATTAPHQAPRHHPASFEGTPGQAVVRLARRPFDPAALEECLAGVKLFPVLRNDVYAKARTFLPGGWVPVCMFAWVQGWGGGPTRQPAGGSGWRVEGGRHGGAVPSWASSPPKRPPPPPSGPQFEGAPAPKHSSVDVDVIHPATDRHVAKAEAQVFRSVVESPEVYAVVTTPFVDAIPPERTRWVDNILAGAAEADRVLAADPDPAAGWVLLPDLKWVGKRARRQVGPAARGPGAHAAASPAWSRPPPHPFPLAQDLQRGADGLYAVCIFRHPRLRSLRDVDAAAARTLAAAHAACLAVLGAKYGADPGRVRAFLHYPPSYHRLHVHYAARGVPCDDRAGRAHPLADVLGKTRGGRAGEGRPQRRKSRPTPLGPPLKHPPDNVRLMPDYYARRSLEITLPEGDPLLAALRAHGTAATVEAVEDDDGGGVE